MHFMFFEEKISQGKMDTIYINEKNPMMQNYLVERRQDIKEVQTYEKMMESRRDEKLIQQFREKISKKTKSNQRKGRIRNISTAAAVTIMMIMGGMMYYYAGQDQSINFKEVVNGAVHTMGKGVIGSNFNKIINKIINNECKNNKNIRFGNTNFNT